MFRLAVYYKALFERDNIKNEYYVIKDQIKAIDNSLIIKRKQKKEKKKLFKQLTNIKNKLDLKEEECLDLMSEVIYCFENKESELNDEQIKANSKKTRQKITEESQDKKITLYEYYSKWEKENTNRLEVSERIYEELITGAIIEEDQNINEEETTNVTNSEEAVNKEISSNVTNSEEAVNGDETTDVTNSEEVVNLEEVSNVTNSEEVVNKEISSNVTNSEEAINGEEVSDVTNSEEAINGEETTNVTNSEEAVNGEEVSNVTNSEEAINGEEAVNVTNSEEVHEKINLNKYSKNIEQLYRGVMLLEYEEYAKALNVFESIIDDCAYNGRIILMYLQAKLNLDSINILCKMKNLKEIGFNDATLLYRAVSLLPVNECKTYSKILVSCLKVFIDNKDDVFIKECYSLLCNGEVLKKDSDEIIEVKKMLIKYAVENKKDDMHELVVNNITDFEKNDVVNIYHVLISEYLIKNEYYEATRVLKHAKSMNSDSVLVEWDEMLLATKQTSFKKKEISKSSLKSYYKKYTNMIEDVNNDYEFEQCTLYMSDIICASMARSESAAITILGKFEKIIENDAQLRSKVLCNVAQQYQLLSKKRKSKEMYKESKELDNKNFLSVVGLISLKYDLLTIDGIAILSKKLKKNKEYIKIKEECSDDPDFILFNKHLEKEEYILKRKKKAKAANRWGNFFVILFFLAFVGAGVYTYLQKAGVESIFFKAFLGLFVLMFSIKPLFKINKKLRLLRFIIRVIIFGGIVFALLYFFKDTINQFIS